LAALSTLTGRSKTFYATQAIVESVAKAWEAATTAAREGAFDGPTAFGIARPRG